MVKPISRARWCPCASSPASSFLFSERPPEKKTEKSVSPEKKEKLTPPAEKIEAWATAQGAKTAFEEPETTEQKAEKPLRRRSVVTPERRGPSRFLPLVIILILLVFGIFYVWSELSSGGRLSPYLEHPVKKANELWNQIWGIEKEDLIVQDLNRYDEKVGEIPLSIVEGKVKNQSQFTKQYIKVKVMIFDRDRFKVAEKEAICGRVISREELKKQPADFFQGEMVINPETKEGMLTPPGKTTPFMVILKDPPSQAKEFKVDIVEAPNL